MKNNSLIMVAVFVAFTIVSCNKKLDRLPTNDITAEKAYSTALGYKEAFAKVYASYALTGNAGPAGNADIVGLDEGQNADFLRTFWKAEELPTDEAVIAWGDAGLQDFHNMNWSSDNGFLKGLYYRSLLQITLANEFLRQSTDDLLSSRGISGTDADEIRKYRPEVRFLRAYQYWVLMDLFGDPPFITEAEKVGASLPKQISRKELFNYVESELKEIETELPAARTNEYGRADQAAAWALLARVYLNAEVYSGTQRYADAITYSKKVIDAGFKLIPDYRNLMLADNQLNTDEFILTINYDGLHTQGYGGTTFLTHASVGGKMSPAKSGINGGWGGLRTTKTFADLFPDYTGALDQRAEFDLTGQNVDINDETVFNDGIGVVKYRNVNRDGTYGKSLDFSDIDFPIFRLAEMYLVYAEASLRGGGGDNATALGYINLLHARAGAAPVESINLDMILNERAKELYWEGHRRTDLIRYGRFTTGNYLWPWKGGTKNGRAVEDFRNLYPLPSSDVASNPNLTQNPGY